jgi:uncharacterized protein
MNRPRMIIDAHVHITDCGTWFESGKVASVDTLLSEMDRAGVDKAIVLPLPGHTTNLTVARCVRAHRDRLIGFGVLGSTDLLDEVEHIRDQELMGIKFHPRLAMRTLDFLEKEGVLHLTEEWNLPILVCGWLQSHVIPIAELTPLNLDRIAKRHPSQVFILAHLGGHRLTDAVFCARSNLNVFVDCSYVLDFFAGTSLERDFVSLLCRFDQKLIFGSDFPEISIDRYLRRVQHLLESSPEPVDQEAILWRNMARVLNLAIT